VVLVHSPHARLPTPATLDFYINKVGFTVSDDVVDEGNGALMTTFRFCCERWLLCCIALTAFSVLACTALTTKSTLVGWTYHRSA